MDAHYQSYLRAELARRCERNPRYSLRAFCRSLAMDPGAMSRVLSGKQRLSVKAAKKITDQLDLSPLERQSFLRSVLKESETRQLEALSSLGHSLGDPSLGVHEIEMDVFRVMSELYHYAILELTETENFRPSPTLIAKRLGISSLQARLGLERLVRLGLLEKKGRAYRRTSAHISVKDKNVTGPALIRQHKEILSRAMSSLDEVRLEKRASNAITMAIDPDSLPLAKRLIVDFCRALCETLEKGRRKKVYQLSVNLFPLEKEIP
jgi:uncharacterized protein (TIGR02147 family)